MDSKTLAELFSALFGAGLSFLFKLIPGLDNWYQNQLNPNYKGLVMLGFSLLVPIAVFGASCAGLFDTVSCSSTVLPDMGRAWIYFVVANQGIFLMTPSSKATVYRQNVEKGILFVTGREAVTHPMEPQE